MTSLIVNTLFFVITINGFHDPARPYLASSTIISYGDSCFSANRIIKTSQGLFAIMNFDLVSLINEEKGGIPSGVVLPMKTKIRIFGNGPALGKILTVGSQPLEVVGIIKDIPEKSCLCCDLVILRRGMEMPVMELTKITSLIMK